MPEPHTFGHYSWQCPPPQHCTLFHHNPHNIAAFSITTPFSSSIQHQLAEAFRLAEKVFDLAPRQFELFLLLLRERESAVCCNCFIVLPRVWTDSWAHSTDLSRQAWSKFAVSKEGGVCAVNGILVSGSCPPQMFLQGPSSGPLARTSGVVNSYSAVCCI